MASQERDMEREVDERIVSGKVVCPQEALLAEFNGTRHEHEQGHQDRELYQHRQTSAHRTDSVLAVEAHHFLLLLHGIFLLGVLLVYLVDFRFQYAHLGRGHVGFPRCGEYYSFYD